MSLSSPVLDEKWIPRSTLTEPITCKTYELRFLIICESWKDQLLAIAFLGAASDLSWNRLLLHWFLASSL